MQEYYVQNTWCKHADVQVSIFGDAVSRQKKIKELGGIKKTIGSTQYSKTYLFIANTYYGKCMIM